MLGGSQTSWQRFEYKYLITEAQAEMVRAFAECHLRPDSHADRSHDNQYPVHSLYLDSADLGLYQSSVAGQKNRFKLRVRFYDDRADTPAFLEIKARKNDVIQKQRSAVSKDCVERILGSFCVMADDVGDGSPLSRKAMERFCELSAELLARPRTIVSYMREAYVDPDGGPTRVTFDRRLRCLATRSAVLSVDEPGWLDLPNDWVVLEIKFTDTFPNWAREMVEAVGLTRTSAAKYVRAIDTLSSFGFGVA